MAHEAQERYSSLVLAKLRATSIFAGLFNNRYEGTPTAGAVKIPVRDTEVAVGDYDKTKGGELTVGTTSYMTLPIDKDKYVNELIDGYDAEAVPDNLVADRLDSAGYSMGIGVDTELVTLCATKGTALSGTAALTKSTIYDDIVDAVQTAKKAHLKVNELWLAVTNDTYAVLLKSDQFIRASQLGDNVVQSGVVGRIAGVDVYESDNIDDSLNVQYILGNNVFCHYVAEWMVPVAVNNLMDGAHIGASAVQGRQVYGDIISRPKTVLVKKKASS